ncbi:hypothetical protein KH5_19320 [Urechidicola sp. KH5]
MNFTKLTYLVILAISILCNSCSNSNLAKNTLQDPNLAYKNYISNGSEILIDRAKYKEQLEGFWLAQCIANWTGLVTEMDKIGNIGATKTGDFYTRENWGGPDEPNIWSEYPSHLSATINFVFEPKDSIWGADDDTDIEYIYQHLLYTNQTSLLSGEQIKEGWVKHINREEENYLWVSNQRALDLMLEGIIPPDTSHPDNNPHYEMIDAQLTTEIFGLYAPARPDIALKMSELPIQTVARDEAQWISEFNVIMYSLTSKVDKSLSMKDQILWMATESRKHLPNDSYAADMYDFVLNHYNKGSKWEEARDGLYQRYQVEQQGGYEITSMNLDCNGCFAAGINFGASIVSLLYGEGDLKETIKIGTLAGWDSDNPTATWGGMIGFMMGKKGVETAFDMEFSDRFNIHRTRVGFDNNGIDTFDNMASKGIFIIDRAVQELLKGGVDLEKNVWYIPIN